MAQRIAAARGTLPEAEDPGASAAYLELLLQEENLYIEGMAHYLSERSPLSEDQELQLRRTLQEFYARSGEKGEPATTSREFRDRIRGLLLLPVSSRLLGFLGGLQSGGACVGLELVHALLLPAGGGLPRFLGGLRFGIWLSHGWTPRRRDM
jgi:hypothetical protein